MLDLHTDALQFADLSDRYRTEKAQGGNYQATMRKIKALVSFNAERLATVTKTKLIKRESSLDKGRGTPLVALSVNTIVAKGTSLKMKDLTTLNTRSERLITGINFVMDYSGSMWFPEFSAIDGLQRIFAQNFIALVYATYLQKVSKNRLMVVFSPFCEQPIHLITSDVLNADWDLLLATKGWSFNNQSSHTAVRTEFLPDLMKGVVTNTDWFCNEQPAEAINSSNAHFKGKNMYGFITVLITDGGMHRLGETPEDRIAFLGKSLMSVVSTKRLSFVYIIKLQEKNFGEILKKMNIKHSLLNTKQDYNAGFEYLTSLINQTTRR